MGFLELAGLFNELSGVSRHLEWVSVLLKWGTASLAHPVCADIIPSGQPQSGWPVCPTFRHTDTFIKLLTGGSIFFFTFGQLIQFAYLI